MCGRCECRGILKRKKIAVTDLRKYVIRVLTESGRALSAPEIIRGVRRFHPINKVTLYRILDIYEAVNIVRRVLAPSRAASYELTDPRNTGKETFNPHFICKICRKISPINIAALHALANGRLSKEFGVPLEIAVSGVCVDCRKKKGKNKDK